MAKRNKDLHYQQAQASRMKFLRFELMKRAEPIEENEDRTLEVVFSSDADVEMWYGKERLLHGTDNVDLSYLNAGMSPLLVDHRAYNSDNQIGVIESGRVDGHKGYATIKFGKGRRANEYYQDVLDGIRSCVSVGYEVRKWEIEDADSRDPLYIATEWVPREISFVTFPADESVGVIRSERSDFMFELQQEEDEDMLNVRSKETEEGKVPETTPPDGGQRSEEGDGDPQSGDGGESDDPKQTEVRGGYDDDAVNIFKMVRDLKQPDERAYRAIQEKKSFAEFAIELTQELTNARIGPDGQPELDDEARYEGLDVDEKDVKAFRITELIAGQMEGNSDKFGGFEREICEAESEKRMEAGIKTEGFAIPGSIVSQSARYHQQRALARIIEHSEIQKRTTLTAGTDATAGHLIDTELRAEALIEWLYGEFAVSRAATWLMDAKGNIAIPKQNGRTVATWGAETDVATESNPTFELLQLSPKELKVITPFTKTFSIQTSVDAENLVRQGIMNGLGEALDTALLYGTGGNQIKGVTQIAEIKKASSPKQKISYSKTDGATYENCLNAIEKIGNANAAGPGLEWITSWAFWKQTKKTAMLTNGSIPIWHEDRIADFMASRTSQVKQGTVGTVANADHAFIANWAHLLVAMWGGMDLVVDPFTLADKGMIRVVGFYRVDCNFAHDEAFVQLERTA